MFRTRSRCSIRFYSGQKKEDASTLFNIPKSACPHIWIRLPKHKWPKSWSSMEDPVVPVERNLYGDPLARLLWERQFEKVLLEHGWEKVLNWECLFVNRARGLFLSVFVDDIKLAGKTENIEPTWKILMKDVDLGEPTSFLDHEDLGCTQRECKISDDIVASYRDMFESRIFAVANEKLSTRTSGKPDAEIISSWSYDMEGHAKKCVERYCELANKTTTQQFKKSQNHAWMTINLCTVFYKHEHVMRVCGSRLKSFTAQDCSVIIVRIKMVCHPVSDVISLLVSSTSSHFQSTTTRSTIWTARPSPRRHVHRAPLPEPIQSTSSAKEPLKHVNYESGRNPRNTSLTSYEPNDLATISGSSLEDIYQFYDVQRELG